MSQCFTCGIEYIPKKYSGRKQKYCSIKCKSKDYYQKYYTHFVWKKEIECEICKKLFLKCTSHQKYCSLNCNRKSWKIRNRERDLLRRREYNKRRKLNPNNVAKDKLIHKRWRQNNPDKIKFYKYKRRALEKIGNGFTDMEWEQMKIRYNNRCLNCRKECNLTIDHILPLTLGGLHQEDNIQPLCMDCNRRKQQNIICYKCIFYTASEAAVT